MLVDPMTIRKKPTMRTANNPFQPEYQRPERNDPIWDRRRDPVAYAAVREMTRRGY